MDIKKGTPQSLATFSIASLGESNWCVTRPQEGHKYPSIILTSPMIGIPLWRRKSMVRVIPRAEISEGWVTIMQPRSLGHDWYVNLFPSVRPKAILQVSDPQIGVAN